MEHRDLEKPELPQYTQPEVVDYGTLVEMTEQGNVHNKDLPMGNADTAYPSA